MIRLESHLNQSTNRLLTRVFTLTLQFSAPSPYSSHITKWGPLRSMNEGLFHLLPDLWPTLARLRSISLGGILKHMIFSSEILTTSDSFRSLSFGVFSTTPVNTLWHFHSKHPTNQRSRSLQIDDFCSPLTNTKFEGVIIVFPKVLAIFQVLQDFDCDFRKLETNSTAITNSQT